MVDAPRKPTTLLGRMTWHLHHPLVALAALGCLALSVRGLPLQGSDSVIDRMAGRPIRVSSGVPSSLGVYLLRHGNDPRVEFEIINPEQQSWDRLSRLTQERPQDLLYCDYHVRITHRGLWYPSHEQALREVYIKSLMTDESLNKFSQGELARARKAYLAWLASPQGGKAPGEAALVASDDRLDRRMVPLAAAKNVGSVVAAGLFILSLWGMPSYIRVWLASRRLRKGRCGVCRYDLRSIERTEAGVRCPECGAVWP